VVRASRHILGEKLRSSTMGMSTIQQIRDLTGDPRVDETRNHGVIGLSRGNLQRILKLDDDKLLKAVQGGEAFCQLLLGPPDAMAEFGGDEGPCPVYFIDQGAVEDLYFFLTAECLRRGFGEPTPWEIRSIYGNSGPIVHNRLALAEGILLLQVEEMSRKSRQAESDPHVFVTIGSLDPLEDEEDEYPEEEPDHPCAHRRPLTDEGSEETMPLEDQNRPWWLDDDENPDLW
jgi:hypothetical protein